MPSALLAHGVLAQGLFTQGLLAHGVLAGALLLGLGAALLIAATTDIRHRRIDNKLNAAIALAAPLFWLATGMGLVAIGWQVALAAFTLLLLGLAFALGTIGGGDVKLLTALALWIPPLTFLKLLTVMALAGGVLTLVLAAWQLARRRRDRVVVPYGIAIAAGGLWVISVG